MGQCGISEKLKRPMFRNEQPCVMNLLLGLKTPGPGMRSKGVVTKERQNTG